LADSEEETLPVDNISDVQWQKRAFERLVLPSRMKELIKALIMDRKTEKTSSDLFYGKGRGLIMLLHGGPGTGKTLSAGERAFTISHYWKTNTNCREV
jgi:hypothetical protein